MKFKTKQDFIDSIRELDEAKDLEAFKVRFKHQYTIGEPYAPDYDELTGLLKELNPINWDEFKKDTLYMVTNSVNNLYCIYLPLEIPVRWVDAGYENYLWWANLMQSPPSGYGGQGIPIGEKIESGWITNYIELTSLFSRFINWQYNPLEGK